MELHLAIVNKFPGVLPIVGDVRVGVRGLDQGQILAFRETGALGTGEQQLRD